MLPNFGINNSVWLFDIVIIVVFLIISLPTAIDKFVCVVGPNKRLLFLITLWAHILERLLNVWRVVSLSLPCICFQNLPQTPTFNLNGSLLGMHGRECNLENLKNEIRIPKRRVCILNDILVQEWELGLNTRKHKLMLLQGYLFKRLLELLSFTFNQTWRRII